MSNAVTKVVTIQVFCILMPMIVDGTQFPEDHSDEAIYTWPSALAERMIDWLPILFGYPIYSTQVTFAAFCLRFDYHKANLQSENSTGNAIDNFNRTDNPSRQSETRDTTSVSPSFASPYYSISIGAWALTHVAFLTCLTMTGSKISTAFYAMLATLFTQPVMLVAVVAYALLKGDFISIWRYDETDEIKKDENVEKYGPFRMDLPLVFFTAYKKRVSDATSNDLGADQSENGSAFKN